MSLTGRPVTFAPSAASVTCGQQRSPEPKASYDVVIVGAGGHGLATAYYLAKEHGVRDIAGRQTARQDHRHEHSRKL